MRPAFSVVFLTTLIGAGQGLFLAMFAVDLLAAEAFAASRGSQPSSGLLIAGAVGSFSLCGLGLFASFFHLGRPERAWRAAKMWRTSWLSREVIALPVFMALVALHGAAHHLAWGRGAALAIGAAGVAACIALFYCTSMIYACIKFLQEWASPFTTANFALMGSASGFMLATVLAAMSGAPRAVISALAWAALALTVVAFVVRLASMVRNARIRPRSTLQSATGLHHPNVRQVSQGFTVRSFNTTEFFHGLAPQGMRAIAVGFLVLAFVLPAIVVAAAIATRAGDLLVVAATMQFAGLVLERWYFLADARHPQNLYYQNKA